MDDRYKRVDAVFDAAIDLPTAEQAAFIDRSCADDPAMRAEVIQLLRAHHRTGSVLDAPVAKLTPLVFDGRDVLADTIPDRIGPFRVVRSIGQGGMGQVYLGERDDGQFEQRVALKLMRHPAPGLVRRFLEERRILASLEHPRIARLVDGGITTDELPYFAMEFVDGEPIDRYCDARELSLDARLMLFEQVCDAVSYAHQHLIVHRDLKPANILVTSAGQVKLLDFGIAKLLDGPEGRPRSDLTGTGFRVMTPDCAAPEQVLGDPVSTQTDVYALGVLLYLLLTGLRPYDLRNKSPAEIERIICDVIPAPPSSKASAELRRRIRGDLDLIVMTALQKEPERRYQSPAALAADVQRFRQGFAIEARPDSGRYRIGKFVARHWAAVTVATVLVGILAFGAARERVLRRRAEVQARKAAAVEQFLVSVFGVVDPFETTERDPSTLTARDLLDRGVRRIDSTLSGQPEVQAELRAVLGRVYANLGLYQPATSLLARSLQQREALVRGAGDTNVATAMDLLGVTLTRQDKTEEAERLLRSALDMRRRLLGSQHPAVANSLGHLATALEERGQLAQAESLYREELAINRAAFGDSALETAGTLNDLGLVRYRRGGYDEADSLYRRSLNIRLVKLGELNANTAVTMQNLAQVLQARGRFAEAEPYYRRSLEAKRVIHGNAHPSVTIGLNNFGTFLAIQLGKLEEGEAMTREAIALDRKIFGNKHTYPAEGLRNLSIILRLKGEFAASEAAVREAIAIDRGLLKEPHEKFANFYHNLAQVRYQRGDTEDAIRWTRAALSTYAQTLGETHRNTWVARSNLARFLVEAERSREAEAEARASLAKLDTANAFLRPSYVQSLRALGSSLIAQRRAAEALPMLEHALEMSRAWFGESDARTAHSRLEYGRGLVAAGRRDEGAAAIRAAQSALSAHRIAQPRLAAMADAAVAALPRSAST